MAKISALPLLDGAQATDELVAIRPNPDDPSKYETVRMPVGGIDAALIPYAGSSVKDVLDGLLYAQGGGLAITSMSVSPPQAEVGSTVSPVITWSTNRTPTSQTINGTARTSPFTDSGVTASKSYALVVTDSAAPGGAATATVSASIAFLSKGYWGVLDTQAPADAQLLSLTQALQTARARSVTYNASAGGYPIYAWLASQGDLTGVTVNGLTFTDYTVTTRNVVNASGAPASYKIAVFNTRQTGASIGVSWA
jgi:hypothetical protein